MSKPDVPSQPRTRSLETVERALLIVDVIRELDGARVSELAEHLDMAPSTVHGYLSTLERNRYLVKEGDEYNIGLRFLTVGGEYTSNRKEGYRFAKQKVRMLADETGERAQFIVEEHGRGIYLHTEAYGNAVQVNARIGKEKYLHTSAAGKAILAYVDADYREGIIDRWGLPAVTEYTITDRDELNEELDEVRRNGYGFNRSESIKGLHAVGVPVLTVDDEVIGALSVSGPANRMQGAWFEEEIPQLLLCAANDIQINTAYP